MRKLDAIRRGVFCATETGVTAMQNVLEYKQQAAKCRQIAAETKNPKLKQQLEVMAELWERLAHERRKGIVEKTPDADVA